MAISLRRGSAPGTLTSTSSLSFANSFWSSDYASGLGILFSKLQQGCVENAEILSLARSRKDAEEAYGQRLIDLSKESTTTKGFAGVGGGIAGGFGKDEGASTRKAFDGMKKEMEQAGINHQKIAANLQTMVLRPFGLWAQDHEQRITRSHDALFSRVKTHDKLSESVKKLRSVYFNKCRLVEDLEEENKYAFQVPQKSERRDSMNTVTSDVTGVPVLSPTSANPPEIHIEKAPELIRIGENSYSPEEIGALLKKLLTQIPQKDVKVPILGTYQHCSSGDVITEWVMANLGVRGVANAEKCGQDLVDNGYLRLVGSVGQRFANSSIFSYQWRPKALIHSSNPQYDHKRDSSSTITNMPYVGEYMKSYLDKQAHPDESPAQRLKREATEADETYKVAIKKLDKIRAELEESMFEHLRFVEKCELDRLKAIKSVMLDMSAAISNVIPGIQASVDNMLLYQETISPVNDLRYIIESYRTGPFIPKIVTYESYYSSAREQTFGVDIELKTRADRKRVPNIVSTILSFLDEHYPDLDNDDERRGIWLANVPLPATHHLRHAINDGQAVRKEVLAQYEVAIVAGVLKLYLLELPDSLVSCTVYDLVKAIYATHGNDEDPRNRLNALQNALGQLRKTNIATLDALMTHFVRLIQITNGEESSYVADLASSLSLCILRPRQPSSLTFDDRHAARLIQDLLGYKDKIFNDLKRASTMASTMSGRPRTATDESHRRSLEEARRQAVAQAHRERNGGNASQSQSQASSSGSRPSSRGGSNKSRSPSPPGKRISLQSFGSPSVRSRPTSLAGQETGPRSPRNLSSASFAAAGQGDAPFVPPKEDVQAPVALAEPAASAAPAAAGGAGAGFAQMPAERGGDAPFMPPSVPHDATPFHHPPQSDAPFVPPKDTEPSPIHASPTQAAPTASGDKPPPPSIGKKPSLGRSAVITRRTPSQRFGNRRSIGGQQDLPFTPPPQDAPFVPPTDDVDVMTMSHNLQRQSIDASAGSSAMRVEQGSLSQRGSLEGRRAVQLTDAPYSDDLT
ncbi:Rho-GTPase-activating protein 8 [Saitoella coloradoensis]